MFYANCSQDSMLSENIEIGTFSESGRGQLKRRDTGSNMIWINQGLSKDNIKMTLEIMVLRFLELMMSEITVTFPLLIIGDREVAGGGSKYFPAQKEIE